MCNVAICLFIAIVFVGVCTPFPPVNQSQSVNNNLLSSDASCNCVERKKCNSAGFRFPCGAQSFCCPSPLTKINITHPTPEQIEEANLIALNECHKYQGHRYHNYTDYGILPGDPIEEKSELDCKTDVVPFVAGGILVIAKEYPFMALLGFSDNVSDTTQWQCGGTLISSQYILTAAHCTKNRLVKWALLGKLSRTNITQELRDKNLFEVIERINHPLYKAGNPDHENHDIAVLKLEKEVPLSSHIRPICLYHDQTMANVNSTVTVAGWGVTVSGEKESDDLRKAPLYVLEEKRCIGQLDGSLENGFDKTTMICAGDLEKGRDSCPGDSGGPLLMPIKNYTCMYLQVGIVSQGGWECGKNTPAIYTRVSHYIPWIKSVAWSST